MELKANDGYITRTESSYSGLRCVVLVHVYRYDVSYWHVWASFLFRFGSCAWAPQPDEDPGLSSPGLDGDGDGWRAPAAAAPLPRVSRASDLLHAAQAQLPSLRGRGASLKWGHACQPHVRRRHYIGRTITPIKSCTNCNDIIFSHQFICIGMD